MSKRKRKEGQDTDASARTSKKVKISNGESSEARQKHRVPVSNISGAAASSRKAEKDATKSVKRERSNAREKPAKSIREAVPDVQKDKAKMVSSGVNHKARKKEKRKDKKNVNTLGWKVSDAVGGLLLDLDPIFSEDEQCV